MRTKFEDESEYDEAVLELSSGKLRAGLWAKALAESEGDSDRAKAKYLKYRVALIKEERQVAAREAEQKIKAQKHHEAMMHEEHMKTFLSKFPNAYWHLPNELLRRLSEDHSKGKDVSSEVELGIRIRIRAIMVMISLAVLISILWNVYLHFKG